MRAVFPAVVASAAFMALWVFGPFPGSAYAGASAHDRWLASAYEWLRLDRVFGPTTLLTKYAEAGASPLPSGASWPAILHAAPGALWCVVAPIQIHPAARDALGGAAHGRLGRVALALAATLMLGYFIIDRDDLYADAHDFAGRGGTVAESIDARVDAFARGFRADFDEAAAEGRPATISEAPALDAPPPQHSHSSVPRFNLVGVRGVAAWFVATGAMTGWTASRGDRRAHRAWALRHVGAGLWVAAQRPAYAAIRAGAAALGAAGVAEDAFAPAAYADAFYGASYLTTFAYFAAAEWAARGEGGGRGRQGEEAAPKDEEPPKDEEAAATTVSAD